MKLQENRHSADITETHKIDISTYPPHSQSYHFTVNISSQTGRSMWRAFFLAVGITVTILGAEFLAVDKAVLHRTNKETGKRTTKVVQPPEWVPWTLLSTGTVVVLYSFSIPRRVSA
ncbi:MAG: hypothetical protein VB878_07540 [Pirellulaceae bacterium]